MALNVGYTDSWSHKFEPTALGGVTYYQEVSARLGKGRITGVNYLKHNFDDVIWQRLNWRKYDAILSMVGQYSFLYYYSRHWPVTIIRDCHTVAWWGHILQEILCAPFSSENDVVMFPSQYALSVYSRILSENVRKTVAYGIELPSPELVRELKEQRKSDKITLCYVGRLSWDKNFHLILKTFLDLRKQGYDVRFVVAGPAVPSGFGPDLSMVRNLISRLGANGDFEYFGYVSTESKWKILAQSDIFVFPVTSSHESLCRSLVEAKSCGLAVVSTRFGPVPELVKDNDTGMLVDVQPRKTNSVQSGGPIVRFDQSEFVDKVRAIIESDSLLNKLKRIPEDIVKRYDMNTFLSKVESLMSKATKSESVSLDRPLKEFTAALKSEFLQFLTTDLDLRSLLAAAVEQTQHAYKEGKLALGGSPSPQELGITLKDGLLDYLLGT